MHSFCLELEKLLTSSDFKMATIYHYCSNDPHKKANAAFLMGTYAITYLSRTAEEAYKLFEGEKIVPFRDAARGPCTYKCTLLHCFQALEWALKLGWYDKAKFNVAEYEKYSSVENGDLNWIIPGKMMAFSTPVDVSEGEDSKFTPEFYIPILRKLGVTTIFRVGAKEYDKEVPLLCNT
eukprot:TRINITY_DN8826_c0_g1_i1.p1 TRINITY_DN8826_c0_g1~~TRINITY_DN8826_c0_g1_i1.p1  ORF type:complete len:179 (-),score=37.69 TRINITY_DN8826_c0_g1_i1:712-1248(-)